MSYSIRIIKSKIKDIASKKNCIWVAQTITDYYVKENDRGVWETLEEAQKIKMYNVEEIVINE